MRRLDPEVARDLLGSLSSFETRPKVIAELPYDQLALTKVQDFLNLSNEILPKALYYCGRFDDNYDFMKSVMKLPGIFSSISQRIADSGGLAAFNWDNTIMILERLEGALPQDAPSDFRSNFADLVNKAISCGQDWGQASLIVRVCGDKEDVERVTKEILDEVVGQVDDRQKELAEQYGWKRAQTPCCSEMGYIVDGKAEIAPIHEVKHPNEDPHQNFIGNLAAMIREGRVQVVMGDMNDIPSDMDPGESK